MFQRLQAQQDAKAREQEEEPGVRPHMLRRMSTQKKPDDPGPRRPNESSGRITPVAPLNISHPPNSRSSNSLSHTTSNSSHLTSYASYSSPVQSPVADEIDRQFSSVFTPPTSPTTTTTSLQQPKVRRVSREERPVENTIQQLRFQPPQRLAEEDEEDSTSDESTIELQAPLTVSHGHHHDGNVHQQALEDTKGVKISDRRDILVPKREARPSLLMQNVFSPPPAITQPSTVVPRSDTSQPSSPPVRSPSELLSMAVSQEPILITHIGIVLIQIDGDLETCIDGDATGVLLKRTVMGEKETAIMGYVGRAELISGASLAKYLGHRDST